LARDRAFSGGALAVGSREMRVRGVQSGAYRFTAAWTPLIGAK
jgi:hypothetical protein